MFGVLWFLWLLLLLIFSLVNYCKKKSRKSRDMGFKNIPIYTKYIYKNIIYIYIYFFFSMFLYLCVFCSSLKEDLISDRPSTLNLASLLNPFTDCNKSYCYIKVKSFVQLNCRSKTAPTGLKKYHQTWDSTCLLHCHSTCDLGFQMTLSLSTSFNPWHSSPHAERQASES